MPTVADDYVQIITANQIRDLNAHYSNWVTATWLNGISFVIDNTLDQNVTVQIQGNYIGWPIAAANIRPVNIGAPLAVVTNTKGGIGVHRTSTFWLPFYRVEITAVLLPAAGQIDVYAVRETREIGGG